MMVHSIDEIIGDIDLDTITTLVDRIEVKEGESGVRFSIYNDNLYAELDVSEISPISIMDIPEDIKKQFITAVKDKRVYFNNLENCLHTSKRGWIYNLIYRDGEYYCDINKSYLTILFLQQLKKENPSLEIPKILCVIRNYKYREDDITPELSYSIARAMVDAKNGINSVESILYLDGESNVRVHLNLRINDEHNIPIKCEYDIKDKSEAESLNRRLSIILTYNNYHNKDSLKVVYTENNPLTFSLDGRFITDEELDNIGIELENELIDRVQELKNSLVNIYQTYLLEYRKKISLEREITSYNDYFQEYNSLKGFKRVFSKRKNNNIVEESTREVTLKITDYSSIKSSIFKNDLITFIDSGKDFCALITAINMIPYSIRYIEESIRILRERNELLQGILEEQRTQAKEIEDSNILKRLRDTSKVPIREIDETLEEPKEMESTKDDEYISGLVDRMEIKQRDNLSEEEKMALMVYKTRFYRAMNKIIRSRRNNQDNPKVITEIIEEEYQEYLHAFSLSMLPNPNSQEKEFRYYREINHNKLSYENFENIILKYIPYVESALSKVCIDEDLVVYRGVGGGKKDNLGNQFLSTSIDIKQALSFLRYSGRNQTTKPTIYRITIPSGSPLIFFTTELFIDRMIENKPFLDGQQEILIDPNNFEFEFSEPTYIKNVVSEGNRIEDEIAFIEVKATPKMIKIEENKKHSI